MLKTINVWKVVQGLARQCQRSVWAIAVGGSLLGTPLVHAEFVNGGFETGAFGAEWIRTPLNNAGVPTVGTHAIAPKSIKDLALQANIADAGYDARLYSAGSPDATDLSVVMDAGAGNPPRSQQDPLLSGGSPASSLRWPFSGRYGALVNLDPIGPLTADRHIARSGNPSLGSPAVSYTSHASRASSIRQRVQVTAADVDTDGKVHVRFAMTPVLDNPGVLNAVSGTATVLSGSRTIVTGTGTNFLSSVQVGSYVYLNPTGSSPSSTVTVVSVDSDTQLTLSGNAAAVSGAAIYVSNASSGHFAEDQPYFAVEVRKITSGTDATAVAVPGAPASSPGQLFFTFNFSNQPGTVWNTTTNNGRNYAYSEFITFDIAPGNAKLKPGDWIELELVASGCAPGGHEGHVHVDSFSFKLPDTLWVSVSGPVSVSSANGTQITYTYTYTNKTGAAVDNVTIKPVMPQDNTPAPQNVTFVSSSGGNCTPTSGGAAAVPITPGGALSCNVGTVPAGGTGTFTVTVMIPNGATGPINNGNYTIEGDGVAPLGGPKWETNLVSPTTLSDMAVDKSGLPGTATVGTPYTGSYTCQNVGAADALVATCDAANLPAGLTPACTIDSVAWSQPGTVPVGKTVVCQVTGTPTTAGNVTVDVTTGADNDPNTANNSASVPFVVNASLAPDMMIDLTNLPGTALVGQPYGSSYTCKNIGTADATANTSCDAAALPLGVTKGTCMINPPNSAWVNGNPVPVNATVTCQVIGTVDVNAVNTTVNGSTNAAGDSNNGNNTSTKAVTVTAAPILTVTPSLPPTATVGVPYTGTYTCTNAGTADAADATCAVSVLPPGLSAPVCTISPGNIPWMTGSVIPKGTSVTCTVTGTPTVPGVTPGNTTTTTTKPGVPGVTQPYAITVAAVVAKPAAIPTLSEWGLILLSSLLVFMGFAGFSRSRSV